MSSDWLPKHDAISLIVLCQQNGCLERLREFTRGRVISRRPRDLSGPIEEGPEFIVDGIPNFILADMDKIS